MIAFVFVTLKFGKVYNRRFGKCLKEFHADVPDYYLPERRCVHHGVLIYHFKIVMGEILFQLQKYTIL
jgi:hypothetical protein